MQMQFRIYIIMIVGAMICHGFKVYRINPKVHGIYTQNLTTEKEIWEHITRGTANYYATLQYSHGEFYVSSRPTENPSLHFPTFRNAYLYPLFSQFKRNNKEIYSGYSKEITLFINSDHCDVKACNTLKRQLYPYKEMLTHRKDGELIRGKIRIVLTNQQLSERLKQDTGCYFWLQGSLSDLNDESPNISVISIPLSNITTRPGRRGLSVGNFNKINDLVAKAHSLGKKIRLEDVPNDYLLHKALKKAGVDYFNTISLDNKKQLVYYK